MQKKAQNGQKAPSKQSAAPQRSGHASAHYGKKVTEKSAKKEVRNKKEHPTPRADAKRTSKPMTKRKK